MKHSRETLKVVVADTSLILRSGVASAIKRAIDSAVQILEISEPVELSNKLPLYAPDILIINPLFFVHTNSSDIKSVKENNRNDMRMIALVAGPIGSKLTANFDGVINLYDSPEQIHSMLDAVMGYDDPDIDSSDNEEQISQREKEIICEVVKGYTNKEIAQHLNLSVFTILTHRRNIAKKLQIHSSTALALYAISNKLVSINEVK